MLSILKDVRLAVTFVSKSSIIDEDIIIVSQASIRNIAVRHCTTRV